MPLALLRCCDQSMTMREWLAHLETGDNKCNHVYELGAALLDAMTSHPSHDDGTRISTTVLTGKCDRRLVWERQTDYEEDPNNLFPLFRGTTFHKRLEQWAHWEAYGEARFYVHDLATKIPSVGEALPDCDRSLSGSPDLVRPHLGILDDYKSCKEPPRYGKPWPDHVSQGNVNRWLVDHADTVELYDPDPDGRSEDGLIRYYEETGKATWDLTVPAVRARFVPKEWNDLGVVYYDGMGVVRLSIMKSIRVPTKSGAGTKPRRVPDIWSDKVVEDFIARRYVAARTALLEGLAPIPEGWEYQSHPLCGKCPFRRKCAEYERNGV
jgi:hypothetical protein